MAIVYHYKLVEHEQWEGHPESPFRIKTMKRKLKKEGLWNDVMPPEMITDDDVLKVHTKRLLDRLKAGDGVPIDPDTALNADTYRFAMLSASVAVTAVRNAMKGVPTFAMTRPPGHHAGKDWMGGFCYLNNVAIAAEAVGVRTAIVDLDAHHCNGTENIFYERNDILVIDFHEDGLYPRTGPKEDAGAGAGTGYNVNIPIPAGSGNKTYEKAMDEIAIPILREFAPELMIVSLGVDAHYCDPTSHMLLNTEGYIELCKRLISESKGGRIAFVLEGGYHLRATAEVVAGVLAALEGGTIQPEYNEDKGEQSNGLREIRKAKEYIGERWRL
ncbi:MAG: histone deacetylase [Methanomassiliicoccaceae archaeon]|jgi:acetoin utilization deacetylase AcuC-like enzyme|nr:histone deacetylase [Methanomassiliicoccaceae archaeon]